MEKCSEGLLMVSSYELHRDDNSLLLTLQLFVFVEEQEVLEGVQNCGPPILQLAKFLVSLLFVGQEAS